MSILDFAIDHARSGRLVFPGMPGEKEPAVADPYGMATLDERVIMRWWKENPNYNICLPQGIEIEPGKFLGVIDVDVKKFNGYETIEFLEDIGLSFPDTLIQLTPSKGEHKLYYFDFAIGNGVNSLGKGIDHRGYHGYVLGAGSWYRGIEYTWKNRNPIVGAPKWLQEKLGEKKRAPPIRALTLAPSVNQESAEKRGREYLAKLETAGAGERNHKGFQAAAKLKDFGCSLHITCELLTSDWKHEPALEETEILAVVSSAFKYGQSAPGCDSPEAQFDKVEPKLVSSPKDPMSIMNEKYALVTMGSDFILCHRKDRKGRDTIGHLTIDAFHNKHSNKFITIGDGKTDTWSKVWMKYKDRREYEGIAFCPNGDPPKGYFNLWTGFTVKPTADDESPSPEAVLALKNFLDHVLKNVCVGDKSLCTWLMTYFAHLIQKPEEKPRVCLVFRGKKGVGKNVITRCIGELLGHHYLLAANRRYLSGNFNSHLENKLLLVLDEAFWSGDKSAEGILKDLITGDSHNIERKGAEPYPVDNLLRVIILGNEDWLVPATEDERRYAVFDVGEEKRGDDEFFGTIVDGRMKSGADRLLLRFLMNYDITQANPNKAPHTAALLDQKRESLGPLQAWWYGCLQEGRLMGSNISGWPTEISTDTFRDAFLEINESRFPPNATKVGILFKKMAPSSAAKIRKRVDNESRYVYALSILEKARKEWETFIGGEVEWDD